MLVAALSLLGIDLRTIEGYISDIKKLLTEPKPVHRAPVLVRRQRLNGVRCCRAQCYRAGSRVVHLAGVGRDLDIHAVFRDQR